MTDNRVEAPAAPSSAQDRQALIAALGFPVLVIIGGVMGYLAPETAASFAPQVTPLLGIVMFGMGLTLKPVDFALVARRPLPVLIGVVAQFVIMPLVGLKETPLPIPATISEPVLTGADAVEQKG